MISQKKVGELGPDEFVKAYESTREKFKGLIEKAKLICTKELSDQLLEVGERLHDFTDRLEEDETVYDAMLERYAWDENRYDSRTEAVDKLGDHLTLDLFIDQVKLLACGEVADAQGKKLNTDPSGMYK